MGDGHEPLPGERGNVLVLRQSAADCLSQQVEKLLGKGGYNIPTVNLTPEAFKEFGSIESGTFVPFWHDNETFDQFTQREAEIDKPVADVISEAVQKVFIESKIPISEQDKEKLPLLAALFSPDEIDALEGYAIVIGNEMAHELAVGLEAAGMIKQGSVPKIVSPLPQYRENADIEIIDFNEAVRVAAEAVYGSPNFYPDPETSTDVVTEMKERGVLPQEPDMIYIMSQSGMVWGSAIHGEAKNHGSTNPVRDIGGTDSLVVLDKSKNEQLTSVLLEKTQLVQYLLAAQIIKTQLKKMDDLKYRFKTVRERMMCEDGGEKWPFDMPAKKPTL
jgi:hypothetical protein